MFYKQVGILLLTILFSAMAIAAKPGSSLNMQMEWVSPVVKGSINEFKVTVRSGVSSGSLQLTLDLPANVELVKGAALSQVEVKRGTPAEFVYSVLVSENARGSITAMISLGATGGAFFSSGAELLISPDEKSSLKARSRSEINYNKIIRNGVKVREYQLD